MNKSELEKMLKTMHNVVNIQMDALVMYSKIISNQTDMIDTLKNDFEKRIKELEKHRGESDS